MHDCAPNQVKKASDYGWNENELQAIRDYLELRAANCLQAIENCEKMNCGELRDWVRKEREFWESMFRCVRWLHANMPRLNRKTKPNKKKKDN